VKVDPNNSKKVVVGTKTGLYFSYDAGTNWSGPCLTNSFTTQRQDVTDLILNIKDLVLRCSSADPVTLRLDKRGPGDVTAGDIRDNLRRGGPQPGAPHRDGSTPRAASPSTSPSSKVAGTSRRNATSGPPPSA